MRRNSRSQAARWLPAMVLAMGACRGPGADPASLEQARTRLDRGEVATALIELKGLVQARPEDVDARLLLGRALLDNGDAAGAEVEFRRVAGAKSRLGLASALLAQGKADEVLRELGSALAEQDHPQAATLLALAQAMAGRLDAARQTLARALARHGGDVDATLLSARLDLAGGRLDAAGAAIDAVLARDAASG